MRQALAGTREVVGGQSVSVPGAGIATQDRAVPDGLRRRDARQGVLRRAGKWWLRHWLRYAEVVGAQWR